VLGSIDWPLCEAPADCRRGIESPKIHKPIDAGERHFRSAESKKLLNSASFFREHSVMNRFHPQPQFIDKIMP
jgi:hypothetical protein